MKKLFYVTLGALVLTASCKTDTNNNSADTGNKVQIDSFFSPDLAYADLRGPVAVCVTTTAETFEDADSLCGDNAGSLPDDAAVTQVTESFSADGAITSVVRKVMFQGIEVENWQATFEYSPDGSLSRAGTSDDCSLRVRRNKDGYIASFANIDPSGRPNFVKGYDWADGHLADEFIVNDQAEIVSDVNNKTVYSYDPDGYRILAVQKFGDPEIELTVTETKYENQEFDDHGNWVQRQVTSTASRYAGSMSGRGDLIDSKSSAILETRAIEYRK